MERGLFVAFGGRQVMRRLGSLAVVLTIILAASCDDVFSPLATDQQHLSMWGYLDASADTQWIRVGIMRPLLRGSPDSLPVRVTLEDMSDGRVTELRQLTVRFGGVADVDSAGANVHNFWTTERMAPGATYRLRAQAESGEAAEVVVQIPPEYDVEVWLAQRWSTHSDLLALGGLKYVAFVNDTSFYSDACGSANEQKAFAFQPGDTAGTLRDVAISKSILGRGFGCGDPYVSKRILWMAGSGAAWPSGVAYSPARLGGTGPSNVTNGIGFVGGVLTKTVLYENCDYVSHSGSSDDYCRLRYDAESVTLTGKVWDHACGFDVPRATVQLREIDPPPPETPKIRSTYTDADGNYMIGALLPGIHYILSVGRNESPDPLIPEYDAYTDTLEFTPGQQVVDSLSLQRVYFPCPAGP